MTAMLPLQQSQASAEGPASPRQCPRPRLGGSPGTAPSNTITAALGLLTGAHTGCQTQDEKGLPNSAPIFLY